LLSIKRAIDVGASLAALAILSPIILICAFLIRVTMGAPVLFKQERPGLDEKLFLILKFRTMMPPTGEQVWFRSDADRVTGVGAFLRKTSLDELPTLINVLRGEMSLVGPRPLLPEYLPKYTAAERQRHQMRPGITGLAQVSGRQALPFSQRLAADVWYVNNWTLGLDLKILWRTVSGLFRANTVQVGQDVDDVDDLGLSPDRKRTET
jgi:lipopolysaccharide/colanic/teichoic acid biosynthesis glycosyltransferase